MGIFVIIVIVSLFIYGIKLTKESNLSYNYSAIAMIFIIFQIVIISNDLYLTYSGFPIEKYNITFFYYIGILLYYVGYFVWSIIAFLLVFIPIILNKRKNISKSSSDHNISKNLTISKSLMQEKDNKEIQKLVGVLESDKKESIEESFSNNELLNNVETSTQMTENISDDEVIEKTNKIKKSLSINTVLLVIIILFVCITIFITSFYIYTNYKNLEGQMTKLKSDYSDLQTKYSNSWQKNLANSAKLKFMDDYVVIISNNTKVYHKYGCQYLDTSYFTVFNINNAIGQGYKACNNCIE